jgi:hypothetical protein
MTMKETMEQELAEAIATLDKANGALARIFNMEEGESESVCIDCNSPIDWEGDGGIIWAGDTFCELCDPLEPKGESK